MRARLLVVAAVAVLVGAVDAAEPPADLVAWWSFDETDGEVCHDAGPHQLHGRLAGEGAARPQRTAGIRGGGLSFTETPPTWVEVPSHEALALPAPFTVAAWIKPAVRPKTMSVIGWKGDGDVRGLRLEFFWRMIRFGLGDGEQEANLTSPRDTLPVGHWCHIAAVHQGREVILYENAEPVSTHAVTVSSVAGQRGPLILGNYIGRKNAYPFQGVIDEVQLYARALSADEVYRAASGKL